MQKLDMQTPDIASMNIEAIAKLFPSVITEKEGTDGNIAKAVDFDLLRQMLSKDLVEDSDERYRLDWPGKKASILKANTPINKTLRPVREDSVNFDTTENLYIEGDNFEVLKVLQESYLGKVKMIYIDPPYNTGKDFVYRDNYSMSREEYEESLQITDSGGGKLVKNVDSNGRFHSDWLSMMHERLLVARDLLRDDGVIFMSIDDNEIDNLRKISNEVFGENNLLQQLIWKRHSGGGNDSKYFAIDHEYVLVYSKNSDSIPNFRTPLNDEDRAEYKFKDQHFESLGPHKTKSFSRMRPDDPRPTLTYDIETPDGTYVRDTWKWEEKRFLTALKEEKVLMRKDRNGKWQVEYKIYLNGNDDEAEEKTKVPRSLLVDVERNSEGKKQLRDVLGLDNIFNNPKPIGLIKHFLSFGSDQSGIVLDYFSGSASTAHAIMKLNAEDGGCRKFIMVQIPEETDSSSEAYKAGYKNICEIGKERIRRAGKKILEENKDKPGIEKLDIGFRVFRLDSSNMKDVYYHPTQITQAGLFDLESNIKDDRTSEDVLAQVMLDSGLTLDLPIERKTVSGNTVFFVAGNSLVACFDENVDFSLVDEIAKSEPLKVVFRDSSFRTDADRINFETRFKKLSPETDVRVI